MKKIGCGFAKMSWSESRPLQFYLVREPKTTASWILYRFLVASPHGAQFSWCCQLNEVGYVMGFTDGVRNG